MIGAQINNDSTTHLKKEYFLLPNLVLFDSVMFVK